VPEVVRRTKAYGREVMLSLAENMPIIRTWAMFRMVWFVSVHWNSEGRLYPEAVVLQFVEISRKVAELSSSSLHSQTQLFETL
jgi:hypothetical protein